MFYIVTTDSDYRHVVSEIKTKNKKIHCIGSDNANISLRSICDTYTKISVLRGNKKKKINDSIIELFSNEIKKILFDRESTNISLIKEVLIRKHNFDLREWGYTKMSKFLKDNFSKEFKIISDKRGFTISFLD